MVLQTWGLNVVAFPPDLHVWDLARQDDIALLAIIWTRCVADSGALCVELRHTSETRSRYLDGIVGSASWIKLSRYSKRSNRFWTKIQWFAGYFIFMVCKLGMWWMNADRGGENRSGRTWIAVLKSCHWMHIRSSIRDLQPFVEYQKKGENMMAPGLLSGLGWQSDGGLCGAAGTVSGTVLLQPFVWCFPWRPGNGGYTAQSLVSLYVCRTCSWNSSEFPMSVLYASSVLLFGAWYFYSGIMFAVTTMADLSVLWQWVLRALDIYW